MMKKRLRFICLPMLIVGLFLLGAAAGAEDGERNYTTITGEMTLQKWFDQLSPGEKAGCVLEDSLTFPGFAVGDVFEGKTGYDLVIDLSGKTLTLAGPLVGPSSGDALYFGYGNKVVIQNGTVLARVDAASLIRSKADLTLTDVRVGDGVRTYSETVIAAQEGKLTVDGNTAILQGNASTVNPVALVVGEESTTGGANVTIDTTGEVNGRLKVLPLSKSTTPSSLTVRNINSTVEPLSSGLVGGISASTSFSQGNIADRINVLGGTWNTFLFDQYCGKGKVSVRVKGDDGKYVCRIQDLENSTATAANRSSSNLLFRFESIEDCMETAAIPANCPEVMLLKDVVLDTTLAPTRQKNLLLNLNGCTLESNGSGVLFNAMTGGYSLSIVDRKGGGKLGSGQNFSVRLDRYTKTFFGYPDGGYLDEAYKAFTMDGLEVVPGTPKAAVYATNEIAGAHRVDGWAWKDDELGGAKELKSALVTGVAYDGTVYSYATLPEAAAAAESCDVLTLQDDIVLESTVISFDRTVRLDLGGHLLTLNSSFIRALEDGDITIKNGTIKATSAYAIDANKGWITLGAGLNVTGESTVLGVRNANAVVLIDGANVRSTGDTRAATVISNKEPARLQVKSGSLSCKDGPAVEMINSAELLISGGTISSTQNSDKIGHGAVYYHTLADYSDGLGYILVTGGEILSSHAYTIETENLGKLAVTGGVVDRGIDVTKGGNTETRISGGLFQNNVWIGSGNAVISGGEFGSAVNDYWDAVLTVKGGRFKVAPEDYVPEEYMLVPGSASDPMYTVIRRDASPVDITFRPDNGDTDFTRSVHPGSSVEKPDDPAKEGFEFLGWYPVTDGEGMADTPYDFQSIVIGAFTLQAKWKEIPAYTVTFDSKGGSMVPPQTVYIGESAEEPDEPVFEDHIFLGWYLTSDGTPVRYAFSMPVTRDIELTALWEEITYETFTVTFDSDGGSAVAAATVRSGGIAVAPAAPVRHGYEFLGWYLLKDGAMEAEPYDFSQAIAGDIALRAKWNELPRHTVAFMSDGGSPAPAAQSVYEGENAVRPEKPVKEDYLFVDWYRLEGGSLAVSPFDFEGTAVTEDINLFAVWLKIPKYTVTFDSNGGTDVPPQTVIAGTFASRPADPVSTDGSIYTFDAWYEVTGTGQLADTAYDFTSPVTADISLKAQWKAGDLVKYTVTYVIDYDGFHVDFKQPVLDGSCAVRISDPSRRGYTFAGWQLNGEDYAFDLPVTADITLLAAWDSIPVYTVKFDSNGGLEVEPQAVFAGGSAFRPEDPVKQDSIFQGWYLAGEPYDFSAPVEGDITVKAEWLDLYTVAFDSDGGMPIDPQKVESGRKAATPEACYRNSYVFDGWHLVKDDGEAEEDAFDFNTIIEKSITLRARWIPVYVVKFDTGGSELMKTTPVRSGNPVDRPDQDPEMEGFNFKDWYLRTGDVIAEEPFDFSQAITEDTTLAAKWTAVYTVTFDTDGGTPVEPQEVEEGSPAKTPEYPKKGNWFFWGWYRLTSKGMAENAFNVGETAITESMTLRAKWGVDQVLTLPSDLVSIQSGAFAGVTSPQAIRLPANLEDFPKDAFEEGTILLAPRGSAAWKRAKELGLNVEEE